MVERLRRIGGVGAVAASLTLLAPVVALAHPAFARKYKTSCQTCHTVFPQLTPFGDAFRNNAYRFPEGLDADYAKVERVPLGAEAYKQKWPDAVWPTDLTLIPPISLVLAGEASYVRERDTVGRDTGFTMNDLFSELELLAGGTLGERLSYYGELEFAVSGGDDVINDGEIELERAFAIYRLLSENEANLRIGFFEPYVMSTTQHRRINRSKYFATYQGRPADNNFSLEGAQRGLEITGIPTCIGDGRFSYTIGVTEAKRSDKEIHDRNYYVRLGYKYGGLRPDGVVEEEQDFTANPRPWAERSIMPNIFYYNGATNQQDGNGDRTIRFWMLGGDVVLTYEDFRGVAGFTIREDRKGYSPSPNVFDLSKSGNLWFEVSYVVFPWLVPSVRWEIFDQTRYSDRQRLDATINVLLRANVRTGLFYVYDTATSNDDPADHKDHNNMAGAFLELGF